MAFETFDLGKVLGTAEGINNMRRDAAMDGLRQKYLQSQIDQGAVQAQNAAQDRTIAMGQQEAQQARHLAGAALDSGNPKAFVEQNAPQFIQSWEQAHGAGSWAALTPEQATAATQGIAAHADSILGPQAPISVSKDTTLIDPRTHKPIFSNEVKTLQKTDSGLSFNPENGQYTDSTGKVLSSDEVSNREAKMAAAKTAATTAAANKAKLDAFPKGSMDAAVESYMQTGAVPPGVGRSPAMATQFWQGVSDRAAKDGNSVAAQQAQIRQRAALGPALKQITTQLANNQGFLGTLDKNIAAADALARKVGGEGSPAINEIFNKWKRGVTGDPDVSAFDFWNNSISGEAAKIASGGVGSVSAASDSQIAHQREALNSAQNYKQWRAAANAMLEEGHNRISTLTSTRDGLTQQSGAPTTAPEPAPAQAPNQGRIVRVDAQGNVIQ